MSPTMSSAVVEQREELAEQQEELAELDRSLVRIIRRRAEMSVELEVLRRAAGLPGTELARENAMIDAYREGLGAPGTQLALLILGLARHGHRLPELAPLLRTVPPTAENQAPADHRIPAAA